MILVGKNGSKKENGETTTTLQITDDYTEYYRDTSSGRFCEGVICDSIYVGNYDCSKIPIGSQIEISYQKAMITKTGAVYQPVKEIKVIK